MKKGRASAFKEFIAEELPPNIQKRKTGIAKVLPAVERMGFGFLLDMGGLSLTFIRQGFY